MQLRDVRQHAQRLPGDGRRIRFQARRDSSAAAGQRVGDTGSRRRRASGCEPRAGYTSCMDTEHDPPPHDRDADEPLGPMTPDDASDLGDTTEVHSTISPHDVPKDSPNRREVEEQTEAEGGEATHGNT